MMDFFYELEGNRFTPRRGKQSEPNIITENGHSYVVPIKESLNA